MKRLARRSGMTCLLVTMAISADAMESGPPSVANEQARPAGAVENPFTIIQHAPMNLTPVELKPMVTDAEPQEGDRATGELRFVTGEEAEQHTRRMKERLADPAQREALRAEQRASIQQMYPDVGRVLGLDEAAERALIDCLTDQQMNHLVQMFEKPRAPFDSLGQAEATTRNLEALRKILGEEGLDRYHDFVETLGERRQVDLISARLGAGHELRADQKERLIPILKQRTLRMHEGIQSSLWTLRRWNRREMPSPEQLQLESQLSTIAANEEHWRRRRIDNGAIEAEAAAFLTPVQQAGLKKYHTEEQERLQRWLESARAQAGLDPAIPEHAPPPEIPEQPRVPIEGQLQIEIRLKVNRSEPTIVTQTVRNGESFTFEAAEGLIAEAKPTLYDDHWLDVSMTYYEQGANGKRRLQGGGSFGVQTRMPDGSPSGGGGGGTVINGRKGYAIDAMIHATAL